MADGASALARFVERIVSEPDLWQRVLADPFGTALAEGVEVDAQDVKWFLGIAGATDYELLEVIAGRLKRLRPAVASSLLNSCTRYLFPAGPPPRQPRSQRSTVTGLPLQACPEARLAPAQLAALRTLEIYDMTLVQEYLVAQSALPSAWRQDAVYEFRRYFGMRRVYSRSFAMFSDQVDEVWHTCMLFTELYADLCQQVFGRFEHHDPWDEPKPEAVPALWHRFAEAYQQLYGEPSYLWTIRVAGVSQQQHPTCCSRPSRNRGRPP